MLFAAVGAVQQLLFATASTGRYCRCTTRRDLFCKGGTLVVAYPRIKVTQASTEPVPRSTNSTVTITIQVGIPTNVVP